MRIDPLQQYARLKQQLSEERSQIEARLNEINQVLGTDAGSAAGVPTRAQAEAPSPWSARGRRGRRGRNQMSMREAIAKALQERGPLSRKELGEAVTQVGYVSNARNLLNSMGIILYARNSPFKKKDGRFYLPGGAAVPANPATASDGASEQASTRRKRRRMSSEARERIAAAQRARWAKARASR
jgi:hypothetical protein